MKSKPIISLLASYFYTLVCGAISLFIIFIFFVDAISADSEAVLGYFLVGTFLTFAIPVGVGIFFLLPVTYIEEKRITESSIAELVIRYAPFPVLTLSCLFTLVTIFNYTDYSMLCFFGGLFLQMYSVTFIQFSTYFRQLKS